MSPELLFLFSYSATERLFFRKILFGTRGLKAAPSNSIAKASQRSVRKGASRDQYNKGKKVKGRIAPWRLWHNRCFKFVLFNQCNDHI
jgi:hypothetical protein